MTEPKVQLDVFEGPLDLLLYLIKKEEVSIYEVNLTRVATQFIEHVERMQQLDLDVAGEFLVMAATLMYIKSRELLPADQAVTAEEEDDGLDPRWELIRQLVEYKKFKDMAAHLQNRETAQENTFMRQPPPLAAEAPRPAARGDVTLFDLLRAVGEILRRQNQRGPVGEIIEERWTVSDKIEWIRESIAQRHRLRFSELFRDDSGRVEVVVTFLALLEMIRLRWIRIQQPEEFGEIEIAPADPGPGGSAPPTASTPTPSHGNP